MNLELLKKFNPDVQTLVALWSAEKDIENTINVFQPIGRDVFFLNMVLQEVKLEIANLETKVFGK